MQTKYSYGPYFGEGLLHELKVITELRNNLGSIYISPYTEYFELDSSKTTTSLSNPTKKHIRETYNCDVEKFKKDYYTVIDYAKSLGIKINFTTNKVKYNNNYILDSIKNTLENINPDEVCCQPEDLNWFKENYKSDFYSMRTFFAGDWEAEECQNPIYDCYVLKHRHLIDRVVPTKENRVLINQSCPDTCHGCNHLQNNVNFNHIDFIDQEGLDLETYYARHLWGPEDIDLCAQCFPNTNITYKISSRMNIPRYYVLKHYKILQEGSIKDFFDGKNLADYNDMFKHAMVYIGLRFDIGYHKVTNFSLIQKQHMEEHFKNFNWDKFILEKINWWKQINPTISNYSLKK